MNRDDLYSSPSIPKPLKHPEVSKPFFLPKKNTTGKESLLVDYDPLAKSLGFSHKLSSSVVDPCHFCAGENGQMGMATGAIITTSPVLWNNTQWIFLQLTKRGINIIPTDEHGHFSEGWRKTTNHKNPGWWFGCHVLFFQILGMIIPLD